MERIMEAMVSAPALTPQLRKTLAYFAETAIMGLAGHGFRQSMHKGVPAYRGEEPGSACPIGHLIADRWYAGGMEGRPLDLDLGGVRPILAAIAVSQGVVYAYVEQLQPYLFALQQTHDSAGSRNPVEIKEKLRGFLARYELTDKISPEARTAVELNPLGLLARSLDIEEDRLRVALEANGLRLI